MNQIVKWLESEEGERWSRQTHATVQHHALIEDHPDLPHGHSPGVTFNDDGRIYEETYFCKCIGTGGKGMYFGQEAWRCAPEMTVYDDSMDAVPYDPTWWFHEAL